MGQIWTDLVGDEEKESDIAKLSSQIDKMTDDTKKGVEGFQTALLTQKQELQKQHWQEIANLEAQYAYPTKLASETSACGGSWELDVSTLTSLFRQNGFDVSQAQLLTPPQPLNPVVGPSEARMWKIANGRLSSNSKIEISLVDDRENSRWYFMTEPCGGAEPLDSQTSAGVVEADRTRRKLASTRYTSSLVRSY